MPSSRGSSWPRDPTRDSCISGIGRQVLYCCTIWEAQDPLCPFTINLNSHSQPQAANNRFSVSWVILRGGISWSYHEFNFKELANSFLKWQHHFTILSAMDKGPHCWASPPTLGVVFLTVTILSSVQFSRSVASDSLQPRGLQYTRLPCPTSTPGVYSNSCPLSQWRHPTISSSVIPFSSHLNLSQHQGLF